MGTLVLGTFRTLSDPNLDAPQYAPRHGANHGGTERCMTHWHVWLAVFRPDQLATVMKER